MNKEVKLSVNNLRISFRTDAGKVQAVRDISFDLYKGETLAIVGESGSGKSVTSKAIMGISAVNAIHEGGEILYDGQDLVRIPEEEMHKLRGDKIAMIFQDPLSALNPIVRIGKQITEAMLLKNKATRRSSKKIFNSTLTLLRKHLVAVHGKSAESRINEMVSTFDKFNAEGIRLETAYNAAHTRASELVADIEDLRFLLEKGKKVNAKEKIGAIVKLLPGVQNVFLTRGRDDELMAHLEAVKSSVSAENDPTELTRILGDLKEFLSSLAETIRPDFFRIGYYSLSNPGADLAVRPVDEMNEFALNYLMDNFMTEFINLAATGVEHSFHASLEGKKAVLEAMPAVRDYFANGTPDKKTAREQVKTISALVNASIDRLETSKDSTAYTFASSLNSAVNKYFFAIVNNPKEEARFAKQNAKREALIARGRNVDWKVVPKQIYDLDELKANIVKILDTLVAKYEKDIANASSVDMKTHAVTLIDFLKVKASEVVNVLTSRMAKEKAIKLMDEVGIPESRIRYNQYPFEFSGGMRQRIVIAIALSANPDILICDEPTTALDVTIQAQILELINKLKAERNLSVIFITHDLGVVANIADKIGVMYAGKIVEYGTADDIFYDPRHPYTWALLSSMPDLDTNEKLEAIPGTPPNMIYPPEGDAFAARNKYALKIDFEQQPPKFAVSPTHWAATWLLHPDAPKAEPPHIITERIERMTKRGGSPE